MKLELKVCDPNYRVSFVGGIFTFVLISGSMNSFASGQSQACIWILDDDESMCALLARQGEKIGWTIHSYHHPRQLPEALQIGQPDLLVLDQLLPEKHGLDVMSSLRQSGKSFPVLILSALAAPSDRIAGLEAGADDYVSKPFHFRELQLRIERLIRSPSGTASLLPPPGQPRSFRIGSLRFFAEPEQRLLTPLGQSYRVSRGDGALLSAFCRNPGVVLSRAHLLQSTGSLVTPGHSRTIDVRLSRLRKLLRELTGVDLIDPVRGQGYRLVVEVLPCADDAPALFES